MWCVSGLCPHEYEETECYSRRPCSPDAAANVEERWARVKGPHAALKDPTMQSQVGVNLGGRVGNLIRLACLQFEIRFSTVHFRPDKIIFVCWGRRYDRACA